MSFFSLSSAVKTLEWDNIRVEKPAESSAAMPLRSAPPNMELSKKAALTIPRLYPHHCGDVAAPETFAALKAYAAVPLASLYPVMPPAVPLTDSTLPELNTLSIEP